MSRIKDRYNVTHLIRSGKFTMKRKQHYSTKFCEVCRKEFKSARYHTKTCSDRCRKALQRLDPTYVEPRDRNKLT